MKSTAASPIPGPTRARTPAGARGLALGLVLALAWLLPSMASAQQQSAGSQQQMGVGQEEGAPGTPAGLALERLPADVLDVVPPSAWVRGIPGQMRVEARHCRAFPPELLRQRIVDIAVQEWAVFGFPVLDRLNGARLLPPGSTENPSGSVFESTIRRAPVLNALESARLATSIGGYWAVTPEGAGIVAEQNQVWNARGIAVRWRSPWSAAFVSWVMCEAGMETHDQFRRAIAHRSYIDQAIRARDGQAPGAAFVAYDIGEQAVEPGDLLCTSRRPAYRNIAERRRQMGVGARSHCDIVVEVDEAGERILAIGGNVLRSVSLKVLPGEAAPGGGVRPRTTPQVPLFAHLKLRADPIGPNALARSPILQGFACRNGGAPPPRASLVAAELGLVLGEMGAGERAGAPEAIGQTARSANSEGIAESAGAGADSRC